jgi:hypothetical protein
VRGPAGLVLGSLFVNRTPGCLSRGLAGGDLLESMGGGGGYVDLPGCAGDGGV